MLKVLIVDDEKDLADIFKDLLEGICNASVFYDPSTALACIEEIKQDDTVVAILDMWISGDVSGMDMARAVLSKNKKAHIIFVTGDPESGDAFNFSPAHDAMIFTKPVNSDVFREYVRLCIKPNKGVYKC